MLRIGGDITKNDKDAGQPLPPAMAAPLEAWVRSLPPGAPLWPGPWAAHKRGGKMLKKDAATAREAWIAKAATPEERAQRENSGFLVPRDSKGLVIDFHALRHTYITLLARSGISPKALMELARHSTLELSMRYAHTADAEKCDAVAKVWDGPFGWPMVVHGSRTGTESGEALYSKGGNGPETGEVKKTPGIIVPRSVMESCATEGEGFEPTDGQVRLRFSRPVQ